MITSPLSLSSPGIWELSVQALQRILPVRGTYELTCLKLFLERHIREVDDVNSRVSSWLSLSPLMLSAPSYHMAQIRNTVLIPKQAPSVASSAQCSTLPWDIVSKGKLEKTPPYLCVVGAMLVPPDTVLWWSRKEQHSGLVTLEGVQSTVITE